MRAIEFQGTADQHLLRISDGVSMRVLLLLDEEVVPIEQKIRRKPSPKLAGTVVMYDDLILPAIAPDDWNVLK
ncbi:MAG: hypothetical protein WCS87_08925 [Methylococcaceae bacterium]